MACNVFVYGTLMIRYINPKKGLNQIETHHKSAVLEGYEKADGVLEGYSLHWPDGLSYPFILSNEDGEVLGETYYDVEDEKVKELDEIERVKSGLFQRRQVNVKTPKGRVDAFTYIGGDGLREEYRNPLIYRTLVPEE